MLMFCEQISKEHPDYNTKIKRYQQDNYNAGNKVNKFLDIQQQNHFSTYSINIM
jgi:hypothetical protein